MSERPSLMTKAAYYVAKHIEAFGVWDKGDIKGIWQESNGIVCISYDSGSITRKRMEG